MTKLEVDFYNFSIAPKNQIFNTLNAELRGWKVYEQPWEQDI